MLLRVGSKIVEDTVPLFDSVRVLWLHVNDLKIGPTQFIGVAVTLVLVTAISGFHIMYPDSSVMAFNDTAVPFKLPPHCKNATCSVKGIHLAQRSDVDENGFVSMTVSFFLPYLPCERARPIVTYGRKGKKPNSSTAHVPDALHLKYASRNTGKQTFLSDWVYHVEIPDLKAGVQDYWYRIDVREAVSSNEMKEQSRVEMKNKQKPNLVLGQVHNFRTPPRPGDPTSIAIVADVGDTHISHRTIRGMQKASSGDNAYPASLAIVAGDIAYADGEPYLWSSWFANTEFLFQNLPLSVSVGNHEVECDINTLEVFGNYEMWFRMPNRRDDERKAITPQYKATLRREHCISPTRFQAEYHYGNSFYAFRHGSVHVVVLNPYTSYAPGSIQYNWLHAELRDNVDRAKTPWVMAVTHNPLYSTFDGHRRPKNSDGIEELFNLYGVNVVVSGHDHGYMRSKSLAPNATVDKHGKAPVYCIVGTGGSSEGPPAFGYKNESVIDPFTAARSHRVTGFSQLTVYNATHALWEFHANQIEAEDWYFRHVIYNYSKSENMSNYKDQVLLQNHFA